MRILKLFVSILTFITTIIVFTDTAQAARKKGGKGAFAGGSLSLGVGLGFSTAQQDGLNNMIRESKAQANASTGDLSSATEYNLQFTFRFSNNFVALQLRPTLFEQQATGSGTDGSYDYKLKGFTIFPLVRIIPLSNDLIDFYIQAGLGYGKLDGDITNGPNRSASFSGSNFGTQIGIGADFCFWAEHCFGVEGNYRYLPIQRNIVSSGTGPGNLPYGSGQAASGQELEGSDNNDIGTTFNGISGLLSYTYNF